MNKTLEWIQSLPEQEQAELLIRMKHDYELFARIVMGHIVKEVPDFHKQLYKAFSDRVKRLACLVFRGGAKRLSLDTPILTPNGWVLNKSLKIGDSVIGSNGKPCSILSLSSVVKRPLFELTTRDNRSVLCDAEHLWTVRKISGGAGYYKGKTFTMTTQELIDKPYKAMRFDSRYNKHNEECFYAIDVPAPIEFNKRDLPIDPYLLGLILGDGSVCNKTGYVRIHSSNYDCEEIKSYISSYNIGETKDSNSSNHGVRFAVKGLSKDILALGLNVSCKYKFIPNSYLFSSIEQRLLLLQGLMDTDGTCSDKKKGASFSNTSEMLIDNVVELVRSLGGIATKSSFVTNYNTNAFRVSISLPNGMNPFRLKRKADKYMPLRRVYNAITSIKEAGEDFGRCLMVDSPDHLFVVKDYLLTHNSTISKTIQVTHDICYGTEAFIIIISESREQSSKDLVSIQDELENNEIIQYLFFPKGYAKGDVWNTEAFEAANGVYVYTAGYNSRIRGLKWKNQRPTKIILDDYESEANTANGELRKKVKDWVSAVIKHAGVPNHTVFQFFGTIVHRESHLAELKHMDAFLPPNGLYLEVPVEKDGVSAWPSRFPISYIQEMRREAEQSRQLKSFYQEMYHIPSDSGKPRFNLDMIKEIDAEFVCSHKGKYKYLVKEGKKIPVYTFLGVDPAKSVSEDADDTIMLVLGVMPTGDEVILNIEQRKIPPSEQLTMLFDVAARYGINLATIEDMGGYGAIISFAKQKMRNAIHKFAINEFVSSSSKRNKWLLGLEPDINAGKIYRIKDCQNYETFVRQATAYNENTRDHDDTLDGLFLAKQRTFKPPNYDVDKRLLEEKKLDKSKKPKLNWATY